MPAKKKPTGAQPDPTPAQPQQPNMRALGELRSASAQLLLRLAALERDERISPDAASAYAQWAARVAAALAELAES